MKEKELILEIAIKNFGFEHPYTISIARMIESNVSLKTLKDTLKGLLLLKTF